MEVSGEQAFSAIQAHCLAKEGAVEDRPWDHFGWKIGGKLFAIGSENSGGLTVKSTVQKQQALIQHPAIEKSAYVGRYGWVTISIADQDTLELALDLIDESYDLVAPKKKRKKESE